MSVSKSQPINLLILLLIATLPAYAVSVIGWESAPAQSIQVEITSHLGDQQLFRQGDSVAFLLSLDHEAYIYMLYVDASGEALQLLPNKRQPSAQYSPGVFMPIPAAESAFQFVIQAPYGEENLWVLASSVPWPELNGEYLNTGLFKPVAQPQEILAQLYSHIRSSGALFGQARLHMRTQQ